MSLPSPSAVLISWREIEILRQKNKRHMVRYVVRKRFLALGFSKGRHTFTKLQLPCLVQQECCMGKEASRRREVSLMAKRFAVADIKSNTFLHPPIICPKSLTVSLDTQNLKHRPNLPGQRYFSWLESEDTVIVIQMDLCWMVNVRRKTS